MQHLLDIISRLDAVEAAELSVMDDDGIEALIELSDARGDIRDLILERDALLGPQPPVWHLFLVQGGGQTRLISAESSSVGKARELVETAADIDHDMGVVGCLYLGPTDRDIDRDANDPIEG